MSESDAKVIRRNVIRRNVVVDLRSGDSCFWLCVTVLMLLCFKCYGITLWGPNETPQMKALVQASRGEP